MELVKIDETYHPVVILSLNRPEKRNSLNAELIEQFCGCLTKVTSDSRARVLIIRGEGPVFCAGLDLKEAEKENSPLTAEIIARLFTLLYTCCIPTIALVQGAAIAGGAGLMAACDFVIAEEKTHFAFPEIRRGLVPALIMPLLKRRVNEAHLKELLLFEESIEAKRALEVGLVNRIVNQEQLLAEGLYYGEKIMAGAPQAVIQTKKLFEKLQGISLSDSLNEAISTHHEARLSDEASEGMQAFLEKRKPVWS